MAQHDYDLANQSRTAFRADLNNALLAIVSQNSGATAPSPTFAYMFWPDTGTGLFKQRNAANTAWITIGTLADAYLGLLPQADLQKQTYNGFTTGGTATAFTLTPTPAITANAARIKFDVVFHTAAGATPTFAVSGQTALNLKYRDSTGAKQAVTSTQVPSGWTSEVYCDGTDWIVREVPAAASNPSYAIGTFSRDSATASGTQAVTGLGFTPRYIHFIAQHASLARPSWGFDDGTNRHNVFRFGTSGNFESDSTNSIRCDADGATAYNGYVNSLDADGFTINWTKVGSPTGTIYVKFFAYK